MTGEFQKNGMYIEQNLEAPENGELKNFDDDGRPKRTGRFFLLALERINYMDDFPFILLTKNLLILFGLEIL